jgi:mono/diheme cytochrome c family protein
MRRRRWRAAVLPGIVVLGSVVASLVVAAQDPATQLTVTKREYDKRQLLTPSPLSEAALKGRNLWVQRCAFCHDGVGTPTYLTLGPWLDADTVRPDREAIMRAKLKSSSPRMPSFEYALQPEHIDQLVAFLRSVTPDQKPTAAQKAMLPPDAAAP